MIVLWIHLVSWFRMSSYDCCLWIHMIWHNFIWFHNSVIGFCMISYGFSWSRMISYYCCRCSFGLIWLQMLLVKIANDFKGFHMKISHDCFHDFVWFVISSYECVRFRMSCKEVVGCLMVSYGFMCVRVRLHKISHDFRWSHMIWRVGFHMCSYSFRMMSYDL